MIRRQPLEFHAPAPVPLPRHDVTPAPRLSVIIPCKGRTADLQKTLPYWLAQDRPPHEIIVVDYSCPEHCGEWAEWFSGSRVIVHRVFFQPRWNAAHARNCGARVTTGSHYVFADADFFPPFDQIHRLERMIERGSELVICGDVGPAGELLAVGQCCVASSAYYRVNGYDEAFTGYGFEDVDFYSRVYRSGAKCDWLLGHSRIETPAAAKLRHLDGGSEVDVQESLNAMARLMCDTSRAVNAGGFGD